jgi:hypothetical protein
MCSPNDSLEYVLLSSAEMVQKCEDDVYAQHLYAALCNTEWQRTEVIPILKGNEWSCSWRHAGGIVANLQGKGDYMNWYCSGIRNVDYKEEINAVWDEKQYVSEGTVTDKIKADLAKLGWHRINYG